MKNQLHRFFAIFCGVMILFMLLFALFGPQGKKINLKSINFSTTGSSILYFKNMRSFFYDIEEREDAKFVLYRINSREKDSLSHKINFVIVNNWLQNESYIHAESAYDPLIFQWKLKKEHGSVSLEGDNSMAHYVFAAQLFEQLDRDAEVSFLLNQNVSPLSEEEVSSLKTSLKDYFKLVGKLR